MNEGEGVEVAGGEAGVDLFGADGGAPGDLEGFGVFAEFLGYVEPLVGEGSAHAVEDLFGAEVGQCSFHDAPGAGGGEVNPLLGGQHGLKLRLDAAVEVFEALTAVPDHGLGHGLKGLGAHLNGSGDVQLHVCHK